MIWRSTKGCTACVLAIAFTAMPATFVNAAIRMEQLDKNVVLADR
ncbi:hypothetical protein [Rhizobium phaseoli]|nr:hypothetical protein [Rhizobium phaseoli]